MAVRTAAAAPRSALSVVEFFLERDAAEGMIREVREDEPPARFAKPSSERLAKL